MRDRVFCPLVDDFSWNLIDCVEMKRNSESSPNSTAANDGSSNERLNHLMYPVNFFVAVKPDNANLQENMRNDFSIGETNEGKFDDSSRASQLFLQWYLPENNGIALVENIYSFFCHFVRQRQVNSMGHSRFRICHNAFRWTSASWSSKIFSS